MPLTPLPPPRRSSLHVAVLAPPWIPVPPPANGGIEAVLELLCEGLVARGHRVTLFAAPGSRSTAEVYSLLDDAHPEAIGSSRLEADHVAQAWHEIEQACADGMPYDVLHDHSGFTALAMADRVQIPVVHTIHGVLDADTLPFYRRHGHKAALVAISHTQAASARPFLNLPNVVPNPVAIDRWPLQTEKDDYLLWIGRMDPVKGAHRAIRAAREAQRRLILAGPIQPGQESYFQERVAPHIDGHEVCYVGEAGGADKRNLYCKAAALLMPIRWQEPFGMVMVEALACGTPVIAFPEGAATEIVIPGINGLLVGDEHEMARAVQQLSQLDPVRCRASVADRYDVAVTTSRYEAVYRRAIAHGAPVQPATRYVAVS